MEELKDYYAYFLLYHAKDVIPMNEACKKDRKEKRALARKEREKLVEDGDEAGKDKLQEEEDDDEDERERVKFAARKDAYAMCEHAGLSKCF